MRWLEKTYDWMLEKAAQPRADAWLVGISASEAIFFPVPPDVMLIPMGLAQPKRVWRLAGWCTLASIAGGVIGYLIGLWGSEMVAGWLVQAFGEPAYQRVLTLFAEHGVWILLLAGFTPIPFKLFTISAGLLLLPLHLFLLASIIGRGARFFLVAALLAAGGERLAERIRPLLSKLGWIVIGLALLVVIWWLISK